MLKMYGQHLPAQLQHSTVQLGGLGVLAHVRQRLGQIVHAAQRVRALDAEQPLAQLHNFLEQEARTGT